MAIQVASGANQVLDVGAIRKVLFSKGLPESEKYRAYHGRLLDMNRIEDALKQAELGIMVDLTDLESESITMDPHVLSVSGKRFGSIRTREYVIKPATGPELDKAHAKEVADAFRDAMRMLRGFRAALYDLAWGLFDGRSALEIDWAYLPGSRTPWVPAGLGWIHPRRLGIGTQRELRVIDTAQRSTFYQDSGEALADIPGKFIWWMPRLFREYPEREGLGPRTLYWTFFKRFSARMRMVLTEVFGLPWRIVEADKEAPVNKEDLEEAAEAVEALGETVTAALAPGLTLNTDRPDPKSHEIFGMTIEDVDRQMSKLYLGNEGTTEQTGVGLGSNAPTVAKGEQNIFLESDCDGLSERLKVQLADVFTILNYGLDDLPYSPEIEIIGRPPKDRDKEQDRAGKAISIGVPVSVADYYESAGLRQPQPDEPRIILVDVESAGLGGQVTRARIVDPRAEQEAAEAEAAQLAAKGEASPETVKADITLAPTDLAAIVTVNEGRASENLPPLKTPEGGLDPDGFLTITAFKAKHAAVISQASAADAGKTEPADPNKPPPAPAAAASSGGAEGAVKQALDQDDKLLNDRVELRRHAGFVNGSPETIMDRGVREGARETSAMAAALEAACEGHSDGRRLHTALTQAAEKLSLDRLSATLERTIVRSLMLGALDSAWEAEADKPVEIPVLSERGVLLAGFGAGIADFVAKPFAEAIKAFSEKQVMSRRAFDRLRAEAKRRAFTVAGLARKEMLTTAHSELTNAIAAGADLRTFGKALAARFESAGWTGLAKSHVEVVFRNATMGAYASGRHEQMSQPEVLAARPYWQILGVHDDRTRKNHAAALNKVLAANDPFWKKAPLPWGHNCRCRKVSRSADDLKRMGLTVTAGAAITALPDEGWDSSSVL